MQAWGKSQIARIGSVGLSGNLYRASLSQRRHYLSFNCKRCGCTPKGISTLLVDSLIKTPKCIHSECRQPLVVIQFGCDGLRVATGPKVTTGHILVKTHHIFIKFEDYISLVKFVKHVKNHLICITVAMATAVYVPMDVCPHGKNYSE